jgi:hypothetical protein
MWPLNVFFFGPAAGDTLQKVYISNRYEVLRQQFYIYGIDQSGMRSRSMSASIQAGNDLRYSCSSEQESWAVWVQAVWAF